MSPRAFATVGLRLVGVLLVGLALPGLARGLEGLHAFGAWYTWDLPLALRSAPMDVLTGQTTFVRDLGPVLQAGLGACLLVRGRRVRRWILRGVEGSCPGCGYDVRGLAAGRCPECGTPVPAPT